MRMARIQIVLLMALSSLSALSMELTAGWRNNGPRRYELPTSAKRLWSAPFEEGIDAFSVSWRDGATGTVKIVDTRFGKGLEKIGRAHVLTPVT